LSRKVTRMPTSSEAEEHLRVIRSLMEKATIYRAISSTAAALGGILTIGASFAFGPWWPLSTAADRLTRPIDTIHFLALWLGVLAVTGIANLYFLWRAAKARQDSFVSSGMRAAAKALLPAYLVAAVLTGLFINSPQPSMVVPVWIVCHGLGLLATAHFAPRSLVRLGWAFLLAGLGACVWFAPQWAMGVSDVLHNRAMLGAQLWMAETFGLLHMAYAVAIWPRKSKDEA
jgi:hypothetical protein